MTFVESDGYSDFSNDSVVCGSKLEEEDDDGDDMTIVSETSWNDPVDEVDDLLSDDSKGVSFCRKDCEGMFFKTIHIFWLLEKCVGLYICQATLLFFKS